MTAIKANGNKFDTALKKKLEKIISKKLKGISREEYQLITTHTISKESEQRLAEFLHVGNEQIKPMTSKDVIGGFVLKSKSKMIDASIDGYITNLTQNIYESA